MNNIADKYNRFLIYIFIFAPFFGYLSITLNNSEFYFIMQVLSYFGIILLLFRSKSRPLIFPKYLFFYLLFILFTFYSTFFQLERDFIFKNIITYPLLGAFSYMLIIENIYISKSLFNFLIRGSILILVIAVVVIIIQETMDPLFFVKTDFRRINIISEVGNNKNRLVSIYSWIGELSEVGFSFVPIYIMLVEYFDKKKKVKITWIIIIMGIIYAISSKARWIMVFTLLVFVMLVIGHKNIKQQIAKYLLIVPLVFVSTFFVLEVIGFDTMGIVNERILESDKKLDKKTAGTRLLAFKAFNALYWEKPFFGRGSVKYGIGGVGKQDYKLRSFLRGRSAQIHVGYLSLFYMYGLVGGFLFLSFLYLLLKRLFKNAKATGVWFPFLGFLGFALANFTEVIFSFYFMGFIIIMVANKYYSQGNIVKNRLIA